MKLFRILSLFIFIVLLCGGCGSPTNNANIEPITNTGGAYQVIDDEGTIIKLKSKPQRILTTHFHLDTMLLGIVSQDRIVAMTTTMDDGNVSYADPKEIKQPKRFKYNITLEKLLEYKPDLIIARPYYKENIQSYRDMGIPVYISMIPNNVQEVKQKIIGIAEVCGEPARGKVLCEKIDTVIADIEKKIPKEKQFTKSAVLVSKMNPNYGGAGCFWDDALRTAKLRNAVADIGIRNGQTINREVIIKADPDFLVLSKAWEINHGNEATYRDEFTKDPSLQHLKAVKAKQIMYLKDKHLYTSNQNCVYAIKRLANMAYGEIFPEEEEKMLKGY